MNQHSSRSHAIVRLKIESSLATGTLATRESNGETTAAAETRVSTLSLVDLAGSESVRLNGTERREEGQYINKSLMALGQVILGLSNACDSNSSSLKQQQHIPYRDSKLTRLLQPSLITPGKKRFIQQIAFSKRDFRLTCRAFENALLPPRIVVTLRCNSSISSRKASMSVRVPFSSSISLMMQLHLQYIAFSLPGYFSRHSKP